MADGWRARFALRNVKKAAKKVRYLVK